MASRNANPLIQAPKVILFDLGGVLMDFAGFRHLQGASPTPLSLEEVQRRWLASHSVRDFELGKLSPARFAARLVTEWSLDQTPVDFLTGFRTWARGFYPGVQQILDELRSRCRLACLSNTNEIHMEVLRDSIEGQFDRQFISCEMGLAKPDPAVFKVVTRELDVAGPHILFFDDSEQNVAAAVASGIPGERVRGPAELRERLQQRGLLAVRRR